MSPTLMHRQCKHDTSTSARPLAIVRIDRYVLLPKEWRVGRQLRYGEIVPGGPSSPPPPSSWSPQNFSYGSEGDQTDEEDVVFGVLYEITPEDEKLLDSYEGVDSDAPLSKFGDLVDVQIRPQELGDGIYNKWYVPARVTKWLHRGSSGENVDEVKENEKEKDHDQDEDKEDEVTVLIYVDEKKVGQGLPRREYVERMNRAIIESIELGMPRNWIESVIRKDIPDLLPNSDYD